MAPQFQTRLGPGGNCLAACIATILDLPLASIPDFILAEDLPDKKPEDYPAWYQVLQSYLFKQGFQLVEIKLFDRPWIPVPHQTLCILSGKCPSGLAHSMVGALEDGHFLPIFDPAGDQGEGFTEVESVSLLVPIDPGKMIRREMALHQVSEFAQGIQSAPIRNGIIRAVLKGLDQEAKISVELFGADGKPAVLENGERP